jgi:hypothetical protein
MLGRGWRRATLTSAAPLAVGIAGLLGMGIFLWLAPRAAAGGWLIAFLFWSGIPLGGLLALLIHALTGGRWGVRFARELVTAAAAIPLMALLVLPILGALPAYYPWVFGHGRVHPDVAAWYLNAPFFVGRTAIAFAGWTALAFMLPRLSGAAATITAGVGLLFYGLMICTLGYDWVLSLEPDFVSTSFGATLAFVQLTSALAWTAITARDDGDPAFADIGGLLLAALLGLTYINYMAVLVIWYGDVPERVLWFVERTQGPWPLIAWLAFVFGAVAPVFSLLLGRWRKNPRALRAIGTVALIGIALYEAYLVAPAFNVLALGAAAVALIAVGALFVAFLGMPWARAPLRRWRLIHGR